ncbi:MAG: NUDIX domain-containing protein [Candidatus Micrarchaeota archaeon]|nr:NUDIX domain-containing protein [Candidatus Micrarchaeota archaeon]
MSQGLQDNPTQRLICVDHDGRETGRVVDRRSAHTAPGVKHLAVQILVLNSKGEIILHERPMTKVGGGVLDAPTTHVMAGETHMEAAVRCLKNEYGIAGRHRITILGGFSYEKDYGDGSCENEFCLAAYVVYDGIITPNGKEVPRVVRLPCPEFIQELISGPENFPPWLKDTVRIVRSDQNGGRLFQ